MAKPISIHIINLSHVSSGSAAICARHISAPKIGTNGIKGTLNGRRISGWVLRSTKTEIHTIVNAANVPIDTNSPNTRIGNNPPINPAKIAVKIVALFGVLCSLCTLAKNFGSNPSFDIE